MSHYELTNAIDKARNFYIYAKEGSEEKELWLQHLTLLLKVRELRLLQQVGKVL